MQSISILRPTRKCIKNKFYINSNSGLNYFLDNLDYNYKKSLLNINLFDFDKTICWNNSQKQLFIKLFYHVRGHFYKFLWCIGSQSISPLIKMKVLDNLKEEFGGENKSHETMYLNFSKALGVDLENEIYEEKFNLPFIKEFNKKHIKWIVDHNSDVSRLAVFSAYEKLDNIDYSNLLELAKSMGVKDKKTLSFFSIHSNAFHFDRLYTELSQIWSFHQDEIIEAFEFIYFNQLNMWQLLSDRIDELI